MKGKKMQWRAIMLKINSAEAGIAGYFIKISRLEMEILSAGCLRGPDLCQDVRDSGTRGLQGY